MVLQTSQDQLIAKYIEPDDGFSTADRAWIAESSFHVRTIVRELKHNGWDIEATATEYNLPVEAVRAAVAFYERNRDVIDAKFVVDDANFLNWDAIDRERIPAADAWIWNHIMFLDGMRTPDEARMEATGTRVKAIIRQLQLDNGDLEAVAEGYRLPLEAIRAAISYYERHKEIIDARILLDIAPVADLGQA